MKSFNKPIKISKPPKIKMSSLRTGLLLLLVFQNLSLILVMRYTRMKSNATLHVPSTCVFLQELLKMTVVLLVLLIQKRGAFVKTLRDAVFTNRQTLLLAVPAICYTLQTNILWIGISLLDAPTYMITGQMKILLTALFSVQMLGKTLQFGQKIGLVCLQLGVILVQLGQAPASSSAGDGKVIDVLPVDDDNLEPAALFDVAETSGSLVQYVTGIVAVMAACASSGFASVYFERMLKSGGGGGATPSLWLRNVQLGLWAILFSGVGMWLYDGDAIRADGLLQGYDGSVWFVVVNSSAGGLLVAAVVKYADNIVKGFATSVSILLASVLSVVFFDFVVTPLFAVGAALVIASIFMYSLPDKFEQMLFGAPHSNSKRLET